MKKRSVMAITLAVVIAGCASPLGTTDEDFVVEVDVVNEDDVPENATIVNASQVEPSRNNLDELFDDAISEPEPASRNYNRSAFKDIEEQLSAAPRYENNHYLRYKGEIIRVGLYKLN